METQQAKPGNLFDNVREYFQAKQELFKLQAIEKISGIFSNVISFFIIIPFFLLAFLFVSITLAHLFAEWWGHEYAGYLTVTLLYVIIGILLVKFRKSWLVRPIRNNMIKHILSKEDHGRN